MSERTGGPRTAEALWNDASYERRDRWAEAAQLLRVSAFSRQLPSWSMLPDGWREKLAGELR